MGEQEAFGPNLRRARLQRGIPLEQIAESTKIHIDLLDSLERSDLSRWPTGIYARAYVRAYASEVGADPDFTVDEFCRLFPNGDRRAERVVREQAALVGHDLRWRDDLVGSVTPERRAEPPARSGDADRLPAVAVAPIGRLTAAALDLAVIAAASAASTALLPIRFVPALAAAAVAYHAISMIALGCTPTVWAIETFLASRHPSASGATRQRFPRLMQRSETSRLS